MHLPSARLHWKAHGEFVLIGSLNHRLENLARPILGAVASQLHAFVGAQVAALGAGEKPNERVASIQDRRSYLWRAIDREGEVLDILVQSNQASAASRASSPVFLFRPITVGDAPSAKGSRSSTSVLIWVPPEAVASCSRASSERLRFGSEAAPLSYWHVEPSSELLWPRRPCQFWGKVEEARPCS
jgi:hypothetical protein